MGDRIHSLDTVKGVALLGVFFLHARWMYVGAGGPVEDTAGFLLMNLSRLAVPLFFLTSGYLLYMKLDSLDQDEGREYAKGFLKKIMEAYLAGTALFYSLSVLALELNNYLQLSSITYWVSIKMTPAEAVWNLMYKGVLGAEHLWFLVALFYSVLLVYLSYRYGQFMKLLAASILLHVTGILSRIYMVTDRIPVPPDDALFFGLFFTAAGFYINREDIWQDKTGESFLGAAFFASLLYFGERVYLSMQPAYDPFFWGNYSFTTSAAAITIFLYILSRRELGKETLFNRYGKNTLWIYIIHPIGLGVLVGLAGFAERYTGIEIMSNLIFNIFATIVAYFGISELVLNHEKSTLRCSISEKAEELVSRVWSKLT
ncbi:MAG: acyltransferase [Candidatus Nanosalina sp.]